MFLWSSEPAPSLSEPEKWFDYADKSNDGLLSVEEAITAMSKICKPTRTNQRLFLRDRIQKQWIEQLNVTKLMELSQYNFINGGMAQFMYNLEQEYQFRFHGEMPVNKIIRERSMGDIPDLSKDPKKWFELYDSDKSQTLSRDELVIAMFDLLDPIREKEKNFIREIMGGMYSVFDEDDSQSIDKWEFLRKDGMADCLIILEKNWKDPEFREKLNNNQYLSMKLKETRRHASTPPPAVSSNPLLWFDHFDVNNSKELSQKEAICGMYITLNAVESEERKKIRECIVTEWIDRNLDRNVSKYDFVESGLADSLVNLEMKWNKSNTKTSFGDVKIKVFIPENYKPGDIITISSPVSTSESLLVMVPEKYVWGGGKGESFFFFVKF